MTAYEVRLVRDGAPILSVRTEAATLGIPREWVHRGRTLRIQPEDEVYVWRVAGGRRAGRPLVDGKLALDMTRIASAIG